MMTDASETGSHDTAVYDPHTTSPIPFNSIADALVARLRLEEGLGVSTVKLFLDVIYNPAFNLDELSFKDGSEIDSAVAAHKVEIQHKRSNRPDSFQEIPFPILDAILDAIALDDELVDEHAVYQIPLLDTVERYRSDCLRTLSLVHRSWTIPCQQRLARRMIVRSPSSILRLLRSPLPGRHTEELIVSLGEAWNRGTPFVDFQRQYLRPGDLEEDLVRLLKRMTNLRLLTIKESGLREDRILAVIAELTTLETLQWHCAHGQPGCDFAHLAETLRQLPHIKRLEISGWSFHATTEVVEEPLHPTLEDLRVCISPGDLQIGRIGWLLQSLSVEKPTSLTLDITLIGTLNMHDIFVQFPAAKTALHNLHSLHLINKGGFVEFNLAQARALVQNCPNVRQLHIQSQAAPITEFLDVLPPRLEHLLFSWFDMWVSPWNMVESYLPQLLRSNKVPDLKRVVIHNYELPFNRAPVEDNGEPMSDPCPETTAICRKRRIELDLFAKPPDWRSVW